MHWRCLPPFFAHFLTPLLTPPPPSSFSAQFLISISNFCGHSKEDKLRFSFDCFSQGNNTIVKDELVKILMANHMATTEKEVMKKAETVLAQADGDGDGVISFDEFCLVAKRFPNILFAASLYGK
jgi:serine/threonine-protein phosphatase 2B regulatory subunit